MDLTATRMLNRFYVGWGGHVFASSSLLSDSTKFGPSLLLSVDGAPLVVESGGCAYRGAALLVRPEAARRVDARGVPMLSVGLSVMHPLFRHFSTLADDQPVRQLPFALFADQQDSLIAASQGQLSATAAQHLIAALMQQAASALPRPKPLDPRIARVQAMLQGVASPGLEPLAAELGISYHRLSHLFSESMGMGLRSYALACKIDVAASMAGTGRSLTDIAFAAGFADSAHFSKIWLRVSGAPPSRFFGGGDVGVTSLFTSHRMN